MKAQSEDDAHAKGIMMRDERYKYISRTVGKDELYDLQADPQEMTNRIDDESLAPVVVGYANPQDAEMAGSHR